MENLWYFLCITVGAEYYQEEVGRRDNITRIWSGQWQGVWGGKNPKQRSICNEVGSGLSTRVILPGWIEKLSRRKK